MTSSSIGVLRKALATSIVKTVNCLMMAMVSSRRIAIDEGVAAMREAFDTERALDVLCAIAGRPLCDHPCCSHNLLKLLRCETVLVDLLKRLLAQQL
eukprot:2403209-Amphidinium_carterae.2